MTTKTEKDKVYHNASEKLRVNRDKYPAAAKLYAKFHEIEKNSEEAHAFIEKYGLNGRSMYPKQWEQLDKQLTEEENIDHQAEATKWKKEAEKWSEYHSYHKAHGRKNRREEHRRAHGQTSRQAGRQAGRQSGRLADKQAGT